jgi:adenine-specific DNA-methyltransferase
LNSNYVITLDRIANKNGGIEIIKKILNHEKINDQINEWKELGIIDDNFRKEEIVQEGLIENLNPKYKFLPIDTKYFKDLELDLLSLFDNLDKELDGWLIHSENYQALNTILPKFKEKVQTIYIDPPFNKEQDADYFYSVKYKDATWATMLENRIRLGREFLNERGSIFVRCDYNGNWIVRPLMNDIFGRENFRNEIIVNRVSKQDPKVKKFNTATDSLFLYAKTENAYFKPMFTWLAVKKSGRWHSMDSQGQGQPLYIFGFLFEPPKGRHWTFGQENIKQMELDGRIRIKCNKCGYIHTEGEWKGCPVCGNLKNVKVEYFLPPTEVKQIDSNWTDISGYTSNWSFPTENSEILLKRVIQSTSNEGDLVIDFFLGSGTTIAVAQKLKRKWIGVEMGEHFYTVVLPRMKKVLAYDKSGISKEKDVKEKYNENNAGGFFKYYDLEQYEKTLRKCHYIPSEPFFGLNDKSIYEQYVFLKDPKLLDAMELDYKNNKISIKFDEIYPNIDIAETLSNLKGKWIKRITKDSVILVDDNNNEEEIKYNNIDFKTIKPLIWW